MAVYLVPDGERAQVRGGIVLAGAGVVSIPVRIPRSDVLLEPIENVLPQAGLMVVHEHGCGNVHRAHEHHPFVDAGRASTFLDFISDVDDLLTALGIEREVVGMCLHGSRLSALGQRVIC